MIEDVLNEGQFYIENMSNEGIGILAFLVVMALISIIIMLIRRQNGKH